MSLSFPADDGPKYDPCPAGSHIARCFRFVDLGTQRNEYKGEVKHQRMVMFTWEIPDERLSYTTKDGEEVERPFTISKRYTWSMFEKATLRKHLESWRGKPFTAEELNKGEARPMDFLGLPCILNVVHQTSQANGNVYAKVEGVAPLMRNMQAPVQENGTVYLDLTEEGFSVDVFESLHEKTREQIASSPEYKNLGGEQAKGIETGNDYQRASTGTSEEPDFGNPPPANGPEDYGHDGGMVA